jgi:hypothetical protein
MTAQLGHAPPVPGDLENRPLHETDDEQPALVEVSDSALKMRVPRRRRQVGERIALELRDRGEPEHGVFEPNEVVQRAVPDADAPFSDLPTGRVPEARQAVREIGAEIREVGRRREKNICSSIKRRIGIRSSGPGPQGAPPYPPPLSAVSYMATIFSGGVSALMSWLDARM